MSGTENFNVTNEQEFQELMESVDGKLRQEDILIFQRPLHAWHNISLHFGLNLILPAPKREPNRRKIYRF